MPVSDVTPGGLFGNLFARGERPRDPQVPRYHVYLFGRDQAGYGFKECWYTPSLEGVSGKFELIEPGDDKAFGMLFMIKGPIFLLMVGSLYLAFCAWVFKALLYVNTHFVTSDLGQYFTIAVTTFILVKLRPKVIRRYLW